MSDVTGRISSMPGSVHKVPVHTFCDAHSDRPAVARVQGETDSFGSEMHDLCQECLDEHRAFQHAEREEAAVTPQYCEWHGGLGLNVRQTRDYDEGSYGRLYKVCGDCRTRRDEAARQELEESDYFDRYDYD